MGWGNPPLPWSELARRLSDGRAPGPHAAAGYPGADGGDSPAWSRHRQPYEPRSLRRPATSAVPYAELHCHSNFSFLDGASHPEELVEEAVRLGLDALAITDHDGFYGVVRFAEAARTHGLPTVFGAELTLDARTARAGGARTAPKPDPDGHHLLVLARSPAGYARLARAISTGQMAGSKGLARLGLEDLARLGGTGTGDPWLVLTGCRKGLVPKALVDEGPATARARLDELVGLFGAGNVAVELWDHGAPLDSARNDALAALAVRCGAGLVATNNAHYATPSRQQLATALAAVRARRSLDELDGWLPANSGAHLRSGAEQARRFARYPGVVERAAEYGRACAFDLQLVAPRLPDFPVPPGHTEMTWLRVLVAEGAGRRYGPRPLRCGCGGAQARCRACRVYAQIDHELDMIEVLGFPGYFLTVWDIVRFCESADIYCQGRGSAANSVVCYVLGVTKADAFDLGLLFERFLSPERDGPPDIDLDIESDRREEAIQYVYQRYGRERTAQVANVITYRARSAVRDMARALGHAPGQQDAWSKQVDRWGSLGFTVDRSGGAADGTDIPPAVVALAAQVEGFPRHLGIHSGGMVICDRPVVEVCPTEWARMADRSVLQWDKDDCAAVGLVKFDLLGLGMLSMLHYAVDLVRDFHGVEVDLADLGQEDEVYDMLCEADSIGVFQVESRAQMATLPRLRPRHFYDLVVEVALIRPGPIQGGSVHPYIRRRNGLEEPTYLHPLLERSLKKTLGVPLFQEQLMQIAMDVGGFSAAESDLLRQAMGSKRSHQRMEQLHTRFLEGAAERGVTGEVAAQIWEKLAAFSNYGFPESHSVSFAYLVYASSWVKLHYPAAFCAALLNAQPMGFYSPHTLVQDARRHGVEVRGPCVNASSAAATLELCPSSAGGAAVRLGIGSVRSVGDELAERIAEGRPYETMEDVRRRSGAPLVALESLSVAGAFSCFGLERREALWAAGAVAQTGDDRLAGIVTGEQSPQLPPMSAREASLADLWTTGMAPDGHPTKYAREGLDRLGVVTAEGLKEVRGDAKVLVAGVVTHRQRPATAQGVTFVNLEDETGLINVVVSRGCWARYRRVAREAPAMLVRGRLERGDGDVLNVVAERLEPFPVELAGVRSRDFR
ncbi:MAG: DNA polymerase III subunit alpha [Acidimicrobiia bacterium]|nr:DNA polymerase III subunit alpha [Acidimicrobiia bacterium]